MGVMSLRRVGAVETRDYWWWVAGWRKWDLSFLCYLAFRDEQSNMEHVLSLLLISFLGRVPCVHSLCPDVQGLEGPPEEILVRVTTQLSLFPIIFHQETPLNSH
jgi:hypothetical protein